jgi:hypothetical protein
MPWRGEHIRSADAGDGAVQDVAVNDGAARNHPVNPPAAKPTNRIPASIFSAVPPL